jgi:hypothetical protein
MAKEKDTAANSHATEDEPVSVRLPFIPGEDNNVFVGLNGKGYLIKRGEKVNLPAPVAAILEESEARKQAKQERIARLKANGTGTTGF